MWQRWDVSTSKVVYSGISFGSALAMVISFTQNNSVFWAIIHGLISWVYVVFYILIK